MVSQIAQLQMDRSPGALTAGGSKHPNPGLPPGCPRTGHLARPGAQGRAERGGRPGHLLRADPIQIQALNSKNEPIPIFGFPSRKRDTMRDWLDTSQKSRRLP